VGQFGDWGRAEEEQILSTSRTTGRLKDWRGVSRCQEANFSGRILNPERNCLASSDLQRNTRHINRAVATYWPYRREARSSEVGSHGQCLSVRGLFGARQTHGQSKTNAPWLPLSGLQRGGVGHATPNDPGVQARPGFGRRLQHLVRRLLYRFATFLMIFTRAQGSTLRCASNLLRIPSSII